MLLPLGLFAQSQNSDVVYLTAVLETTSRKKASYYRTKDGMQGDLHVGKTFDLEGRLKADGRYADPDLTIEHGEFVFYHANGEVESRGEYVMGNKSGIWERFDQWGRPLAEKVYEPEALANIVYTRAQTMPKYREGDDRELVRYIKEKVTGPDGRRVKGAYTACFIVEKDGELTDIKVLQTKGPQIQEQMVDAIRNTAPWQPGAERGQPVRVQVRIPVQF